VDILLELITRSADTLREQRKHSKDTSEEEIYRKLFESLGPAGNSKSVLDNSFRAAGKSEGKQRSDGNSTGSGSGSGNSSGSGPPASSSPPTTPSS